MSVEKGFTKENLDYYLKELAKEFRKRNGKNTPAEIVLVGGAAILANYGFREMTYDIDAVITASSAMKEAVHAVGDRLGLPNGWLNADFKKTSSYSPKLPQYSKYYRTYSNVLNIRTISAEYLVAMKLMLLSVKLDAPAPCRLVASDLDFACRASADCLPQHLQVI